jgi:hypothetical protein
MKNKNQKTEINNLYKTVNFWKQKAEERAEEILDYKAIFHNQNEIVAIKQAKIERLLKECCKLEK